MINANLRPVDSSVEEQKWIREDYTRSLIVLYHIIPVKKKIQSNYVKILSSL